MFHGKQYDQVAPTRRSPGQCYAPAARKNTTMSGESYGQQSLLSAPIHMRLLLMLCSPWDTCVLCFGFSSKKKTRNANSLLFSLQIYTAGRCSCFSSFPRFNPRNTTRGISHLLFGRVGFRSWQLPQCAAKRANKTRHRHMALPHTLPSHTCIKLRSRASVVTAILVAALLNAVSPALNLSRYRSCVKALYVLSRIIFPLVCMPLQLITPIQ